MTLVLETTRLRLREFRSDDLAVLAAMFEDAEQMRFYPRKRTRREASEWLRRNQSLYAKCGFGFWLVEDRATLEFAGYCGIRPLHLEGAAVTEIGWHTKKTAWNRGIATEAATAVRDAAFERFAQTRLVALITPDNGPSRRVADKIGMHEAHATMFEGVSYLTYVHERGS